MGWPSLCNALRRSGSLVRSVEKTTMIQLGVNMVRLDTVLVCNQIEVGVQYVDKS